LAAGRVLRPWQRAGYCGPGGAASSLRSEPTTPSIFRFPSTPADLVQPGRCVGPGGGGGVRVRRPRRRCRRGAAVRSCTRGVPHSVRAVVQRDGRRPAWAAAQLGRQADQRRATRTGKGGISLGRGGCLFSWKGGGRLPLLLGWMDGRPRGGGRMRAAWEWPRRRPLPGPADPATRGPPKALPGLPARPPALVCLRTRRPPRLLPPRRPHGCARPRALVAATLLR
jgi:hypothetical protein